MLTVSLDSTRATESAHLEQATLRAEKLAASPDTPRATESTHLEPATLRAEKTPSATNAAHTTNSTHPQPATLRAEKTPSATNAAHPPSSDPHERTDPDPSPPDDDNIDDDQVDYYHNRACIEAGLAEIKHDAIRNLHITVNLRGQDGNPTRASNIAAARLLTLVAHEERRLDRFDELELKYAAHPILRARAPAQAPATTHRSAPEPPPEPALTPAHHRHAPFPAEDTDTSAQRAKPAEPPSAPSADLLITSHPAAPAAPTSPPRRTASCSKPTARRIILHPKVPIIARQTS